MPINFHDKNNKSTYAAREADDSWKQLIELYVSSDDITALDIGCGGGIYSKALAQMGIENVIGMDFSESNLEGASGNCKSFGNIRFVQGNALKTGLADNAVDLILERALIHHIEDINACFLEAARIIRPNGILIVQDRTPDDCVVAGNDTHIRGYFFEKYPKLIAHEVGRRHTSANVIENLLRNDFEIVEQISFWETRRRYSEFTELEEDLRNRTGRSILHELSDEEVNELIGYINMKFIDKDISEIEDADRWTIWIARKMRKED